MSERQTGRRRPWKVLLMVLVLAAACEVVALVTVPLQRRLGLDTRKVEMILAEQTAGIRARLADTADLIILDSVLGWRNRPGYSSGPDRINRAGVRSVREYDSLPPTGTLRVATFGAAYVYGAEVPNDTAWAAMMERASPRLEVVNYGVGGYGTDQAYLLYLREGRRLDTDVVLIGFDPFNLIRSMYRYTRFISTDEAPLTKPRFKLDAAGALALVPNPLPGREDWERVADEPRRIIDAGVDDGWYDALRYENPLYDRSAAVRVTVAVALRVWRRFLWSGRPIDGGQFRTESPAFAVQQALMTTFADSVRARGATPIFVMLPDQSSVWAVQSGKPAILAPLRDALREAGATEVLDLVDAFATHAAERGDAGLFAPGGHYGPAGNRIVATRVMERLRELRLLN